MLNMQHHMNQWTVATSMDWQVNQSMTVVDNGKLQGIVTTTDLINYLLEQY